MSTTPLLLLTVAAATAAAALTTSRLRVGPVARRIEPRRPAVDVAGAGRRAIPRHHQFGLLVAAGGVAAMTIGAFPVALATGVVVVARALAVRRRRHRRQRKVDAALPDTVGLLVLILHAGATPVAAIRELRLLAPEAVLHGLDAVVHRLDRGQRLADALAELPRVLGPGARPLADGIAAAERDGLPLAPLLERLDADSRSARRRAAETDARRLPVRLSFPLVLCTLPSFLLLGIVPVLAGALESIHGLGG